jgi:MFS family permease
VPTPSAAPASSGRGHLLAFAALSASYFAHIGFFNPYLPLWLKDQGLPIFTISLLAAVQSFTRVFAPYAWGALSDHTGERVRLLRIPGIDLQPCGGTHVANTSEIGRVVVTKIEKKSATTRRVVLGFA